MMNDDELKLLGLRALAQHHIKTISDIEKAAMAITGETMAHGHTADWIWGENFMSVRELIDYIHKDNQNG